MKIKIEAKTIPAIVFFVAAMALLVASARTTTLAEKAADDARNGLISTDKAMPAIDFTLPVVAPPSKEAPQTVNLLSTAKRTPVVFSFWAGYCQYCPLEMSHLETYAEKYKGKVQFYTVNSHDTPASILRYKALHAVTLPVLSDATHQVSINYGIDSLPTLFIVDTDGRVRYVSNGYDPDMDKVFPKLLNSLIAN